MRGALQTPVPRYCGALGQLLVHCMYQAGLRGMLSEAVAAPPVEFQAAAEQMRAWVLVAAAHCVGCSPGAGCSHAGSATHCLVHAGPPAAC